MMGEKKAKLLLVENDKVDQLALERLARKEGFPYEYMMVASIQEAKEALHASSFDMVITDYLLDDGTGLEMLDIAQETPVVFVTGSGDEEVAVEAMKAGAYDYLIKDPEGNYLTVLPLTIDSVLQRKQGENELEQYKNHLEYLVENRTQALQRSEELLRETQHIAKIGGWEWDLVSNKLWWSEELYQLFQISPKDFIPSFEKFQEFVHPEDQIHIQPIIDAPLTKKQSFFTEYRIILPNGSVEFFQTQAHLDFDDQQEPIRIIGTTQNINKRKQAELRQQKYEQELFQIMEAIPIGIYVLNKEGKPYYANKTAQQILGKGIISNASPEKLPEIYQAYHKDTKELYPFEQLPIIKALNGISSSVNNVVIHQQDNKIPLQIDASPILDNKGNVDYAVAVFQDMTENEKKDSERRDLEFQLYQSQKMEAIGTLAGGIAHDFNNILQAVFGYMGLAYKTLPQGSLTQNYIEQCMSAARRAKDLVQQILTFSRQSEQEFQAISIIPMIKESLKLLRASLPTTIEIEENLDPECGNIWANPTQIHQVLMNLCTNAGYAMRDSGGVLRIDLKQVDHDIANNATLQDLEEKAYVQLTLSDTGIGMNSEIKERIFEPFFTTKPKEEGTGLGLSVVHGIVKNHGGTITVESAPNQGTTFQLFFPIATQKQTTTQDIDSAGIASGQGNILLVEDEPMLIEIITEWLEDCGYQVTNTTSSTEALEIFNALPDFFDMVLTDQTMPRMTGDQLAQAIFKDHPDQAIVIMTGFTHKIDQEKSKKMGVRQLLIKPFEKEQLAAAIQKVIARSD
ncbi:MAG: response regulator [SAR324 cluster bacterium]|nr:response regulator [SAR324 cluster bacterium]